MKKIFLLLSINSLFIPSLYTVSCSSFLPHSGIEAPKLTNTTLINYPINKYNNPNEERNFIFFLENVYSNYKNSFNKNGVYMFTYKNPETMIAKESGRHVIYIKELEEFNYDVYKFELSVYTSQPKTGRFMWVESKKFEMKMIYDLENSEVKRILRNYKFLIKDFINIDSKVITYKHFFDSFELYLKELASEYFLNKFKTDFDIYNAEIDDINLWDRYGEYIKRDTSKEKNIQIKEGDYFYLSYLNFQKDNEININSRFWGHINFLKYPGEPEISGPLDVSDVVIEDIKSYRQSLILLFLFNQKTLPSDISKIVSDSIKEQKQITQANINWKNEANSFLAFDKDDKQYFSTEEEMQAYFDSGETEIQLYLDIYEENNDPQLKGVIWININCDRK